MKKTIYKRRFDETDNSKYYNFYETNTEYVAVDEMAGTLHITSYKKRDVERLFTELIDKKEKWMGEPNPYIKKDVVKLNNVLKNKLSKMKDYISTPIIVNFWLDNKPEYIIDLLFTELENKGLYTYKTKKR